jgi:predicted phosphodiesterase
MRILILSDLHLDFAPFKTKGRLGRDADLVVLAGDIAESIKGIKWARHSFPDKRIVYVGGNHEYYEGHFDSTLDEMRAAAKARAIDFLEDDEISINGVRILGCTLWVDFDYFGRDQREASMAAYEKGLYDCEVIRAGDSSIEYSPARSPKLTPQLVLERHEKSPRWLGSKLSNTTAKTLVVTHHAPTPQSVVERFRSDPLTPGFVSLLPVDLIQRADIWVHGHMHDSLDHVVDQGGAKRTRVVCNPRGYPTLGAFENPRFEPEKYITI